MMSNSDSAASRMSSHPCVLTVEDNAFFARIYRSVFTKLGCRLVQVAAVAEALHALDEIRPDLVLVDIRLPDGSGLAVIQAVRARDDLASVPVVAVTTRTDPETERIAREAGATDFLAKPINLEDLRFMALRHLASAPSDT
jgi:two-component system, repressor protein LuxO